MTFRCSNGSRQEGQLSQLLYNEYTPDLTGVATGVGCYVGGVWVNTLSYADDMVLLALTVAALQTLLEVCRADAGPHDIVYIQHNAKVCMLVLPKQSQGRYSTRVRLGNEELSYQNDFRYLEHVMTGNCGDDKKKEKYFRSQNSVGNMLVKKFSCV